ncbi:MAG: hypothetical protein HOW73_00405 [Polyangiaceae bacterium]|nr:hypothetical protein [Polyangiaceae bacterium]
MKAWILALMLHLSPQERWKSLPGHEETVGERRARYESIAADIATTVGEGDGIDRNRHQDAALLVAVTFLESGFQKDVDVGPCYRPSADSKRCDSGRAACLAQIRIRDGRTSEHTHGIGGLTQEDLFKDRKKCLAIAKHMLRRSFRACAKDGPDARMDVYASGRCGVGREEGKKRLKLAEKLMSLAIDKETGDKKIADKKK